jgi:WD40 repeat protein
MRYNFCMGDTEQYEPFSQADTDVEISDLARPEGEEQRHLAFSRWINSAFERRFGPKRSPRPRVGAITTIVFVVLALLLIVVSYQSGLLALLAKVHFQTSTSSPPRIVPEALAQSSAFSCVMDAAWSPNSDYIAILGYHHDCTSYTPEPGLMAVYDVHTNRKIEQIALDTPALQALHHYSVTNVGIFYHSILWSPDGTRLAVLFSVASSVAPFEGILLVDRNDGHVKVMLYRDVSTTLANEYLAWDMTLGKAAHVSYTPLISHAFTYIVNVPVAISYTWGSDGTLIPGADPNIPPILIGPTGNPDGGASFTPWQSGQVSLTFQNGNSPVYLPGVYAWSTSFAAWSPDGRYLADGIDIAGQLTSPTILPMSGEALQALQAAGLPTIPVRDAGMAQIVAGLKVPTITSPGTVEENVAWRPDGRVVAVMDGANHIDIYDCASGHLLTVLSLPVGVASDIGGLIVLRWSPDGQRLLASGPMIGIGVVWGPGQLPRV